MANILDLKNEFGKIFKNLLNVLLHECIMN